MEGGRGATRRGTSAHNCGQSWARDEAEEEDGEAHLRRPSGRAAASCAARKAADDAGARPASRGRLFGGFALLILAALSIALPFHLHHHGVPRNAHRNCRRRPQAQHLQLAQENINRLNSSQRELGRRRRGVERRRRRGPPRVAPTAAALPLATTLPAAASARRCGCGSAGAWREGRAGLPVPLRSIVESLLSSLSHPMRAATEVVAMNNNEPLDAHASSMTRSASSATSRASSSSGRRPALDCPKAGKLRGAVQEQTCDRVATFETLLQLQPPSEMLLMLEDDWLLCPNGMLALQVDGPPPPSPPPPPPPPPPHLHHHPRAAARHREGVALRPALARAPRLVRLQRRVGAPGRRPLARRPPPSALREKGARPSAIRVVLG